MYSVQRSVYNVQIILDKSVDQSAQPINERNEVNIILEIENIFIKWCLTKFYIHINQLKVQYFYSVLK